MFVVIRQTRQTQTPDNRTVCKQNDSKPRVSPGSRWEARSRREEMHEQTITPNTPKHEAHESTRRHTNNLRTRKHTDNLRGFAHERHVVLDEVGVLHFTQVVVVQLVVFHVPGLHEHPVQPILHPPHHRLHAELRARAGRGGNE